MNGAKKLPHRIRLYELQEGLCYYCKNKMLYPYLTTGGQIPDKYPTFEHLNSRLSGKYNGGIFGSHVVLACTKCNNSRAKKEVETIYKAEHKRRSMLGMERRKIKQSKIAKGNDLTQPLMVYIHTPDKIIPIER